MLYQKGHKQSNTGKTHFKKGNTLGFRQGEHTRSQHWNWKDGMRMSCNRLYVLMPQHPFCNKNKYVRYSRLIMEKYLGRYLSSKEIVYHKDKNSANDNLDNLMLFPSRKEYVRFQQLS